MSYGTVGGRDGHSTLDAYRQAVAAAADGVVHHVIVLDFSALGWVRILGRDRDGQVTFHTECGPADLPELLAALDVGAELTDTVDVLTDGGLDFSDAAATAAELHRR